jgi:hypothetical protein
VRALVAAALAACAAGASAQAAVAFSFAAFGDTPYNELEALAVEQVLRETDQAGVAFVVHVGDLKAASEPCSDRLLRERRALLDRSPRPLVYVPGDNEWTDCHRPSAGGYDPRERLDALRRIFFADDESLGREKLRVVRQGDVDARFRPYRENLRWIAGNVAFVTLNVPGSNNNLGRTAPMDAEHAERMTADFAWLAQAVDIAREPAIRGLVVFAHGDPRFQGPADPTDGYTGWRYALRAHASTLGKPVLYIHGDGHRYRVDQPLRNLLTHDPVPTFTSAEVFGSPTVGWVRVTVDPDAASLFSIAPGGDPAPASQ